MKPIKHILIDDQSKNIQIKLIRIILYNVLIYYPQVHLYILSFIT